MASWYTMLESPNGPRGSNSLTGAIETSIFVERKERQVTISCENAKESEGFPSIVMFLKQIRLSDECDDTSCVLALPTNESKLSKNKLKALSELRTFASAGATIARWVLKSAIPETTLKNYAKELEELGLVEKRDARYIAAEFLAGEGSSKQEGVQYELDPLEPRDPSRW